MPVSPLDLLVSGGLALDLNSIKGSLGVVIGVGLLIFIHELGHFLAAKWAGVKVEVFSLGFGKRLVGFERGGTDYRISMLPLGGYVRMLGQADDDPGQAPTTDEGDFRNKSPGKRFVILVAGVVMNLLLAAVGFVLAFGLGIEFTAPEVGSVDPGSPAARADLRPGDQILAVDDDEVLGFQDLQTLVALASGDITLTVRRDGATITTTARPVRAPGESYARLGVQQPHVVGAVSSSSPLAATVILPTPARSDRILNVSPVDSRCAPDARMTPDEVTRAIDGARGRVVVNIARTSYDSRGAPTGVQPIVAEVDVPQRPEMTLGLDVLDGVWARAITKGSPADKAGLVEGDRILSMGDITPIRHATFKDSLREAGARSGGAPVPFLIERVDAAGATTQLTLPVTLELENGPVVDEALRGVTDEAQRAALRRQVGKWFLGVDYRADVIGGQCALPLADASAEPILLQPGDRLLSVWLEGGAWWSGEEAFRSPAGLLPVLRARGAEPIKLSWLPKGAQKARSAVVAARQDGDRTYGDLGVQAGLRQVIVERGPLDACALGLHQTVVQTERLLYMLRSFLTGGVSPRELGGPILIVSTAYAVATGDSLAKLIHLLAILSVNLAVINILPIPVLDGGHILFLGIEKLKGRPVSNDVLNYAQWAGLIVILGLMALVFFNDIRRVFTGS